MMKCQPLLKRAHLNSESSLDAFATPAGPRKKRLSESAPINHTNMRIQQLYHTHSKAPNPPPVTGAVTSSTNRKNTAQKRTVKSTTKSQPRAPKQRSAASAQSNKAAKSAINAPVQPSASNMYASSLNSKQISYSPDNKSLLGETFPDNSFGWTSLNPPSSAQGDALKFDQILQQHQPNFASTVTPTSPVQVVFTSHVDLPPSEQPKYHSYSNNLITESTPITWVTDASATKQPLLQPATILPATLLPTTMAPVTTPRPLKMVIPAPARKPPVTATNPRPSAKQPKTIRRKAVPDTLPTHAKIVPQPSGSTAIAPNQPILPLTPSITDHSSLQISSISQKLPTASIMNLNLLNTSSKLPTQILQTTNLAHTKPTTIAPQMPVTLAMAKPKIQVTQQIIVSSPNKQFQSKGNVKLVQSANGSIVLKGTSDLVVPTTSVAMSPLTGTIIGSKTPFPKIQLVKGTASNMILMHKVANPFGGQTTGTAIKDGRPMKFNVVPPKVNTVVQQPPAPVIVYDVTGKPVQPVIKPTTHLSNVQITEDTPVDILPGENMIIDVTAPTVTTVQPAPPIITSNHIILDGNLKTVTAVATNPRQKAKSIRLQPQPIVSPEPKRLRIDEASSTTTTTTAVIAAASEIIEPTDWEEQLDQQNTKSAVSAAVVAAAPMDGLIEEDVSGEEGAVGGYMTSEETNDDIIQYEGGECIYLHAIILI